ncbi:MAG: ribosomal RNA small subunit methyltransferase A, partial [Nitrososphaerales archaeon]
MRKRRRLGQHLLRDPEILDRIVKAAYVSSDDTVFEIGTGEGDLTERLCISAGRVISTEIDRTLLETAERRLKEYRNLELILGDGFGTERSFDILVSNIPYSKSGRFIEWLAGRRFKRAVVTVQREFADKVLAELGSHNYRAVSVLAQALFQIQRLFDVGRDAFDPPPKVSSSVLLFRPRGVGAVNRQTVSSLKTLFSFRGRRVSSA